MLSILFIALENSNMFKWKIPLFLPLKCLLGALQLNIQAMEDDLANQLVVSGQCPQSVCQPKYHLTQSVVLWAEIFFYFLFKRQEISVNKSRLVLQQPTLRDRDTKATGNPGTGATGPVAPAFQIQSPQLSVGPQHMRLPPPSQLNVFWGRDALWIIA